MTDSDTGTHGHRLNDRGNIVPWTNTTCPICNDPIKVKDQNRRPPNPLPDEISRYQPFLYHTDCLLSLGKWRSL